MSHWLTRLACLLPREGRTTSIFLRTFGAFAVLLLLNAAWVWRYGKRETWLSWTLVVGLGLSFYALFVLWTLVSMRRVTRRGDQAAFARGEVPAMWRATLLLPYRRADIAAMGAQGRLAELMVASFVLVTLLGALVIGLLKPWNEPPVLSPWAPAVEVPAGPG
jgi:hypothetical protein